MKGLYFIFFCVIAAFSTGVGGQKKYSPEFFQMLQSVLSKLKVDKTQLASLGGVGSLLQEVTIEPDMFDEPSTPSPTVAPVRPSQPSEDYCEKQSPVAFANFCRTPGMAPGYYVDPWDPYCGFILCHPEGNASRHYCEKGSWTGFKATSSGRQAMCRVQLKVANRVGRCVMATFNGDMCRKAEWVVEYNSLIATL